jgi:DNA-binding transcriptional regulator YdaS (Cro superfamily)
MDIKDIIKAAGGCAKLARALGCHHTSILGWKQVPPKRVPAVSHVTGISRHALRPDMYEAPQNTPDNEQAAA